MSRKNYVAIAECICEARQTVKFSKRENPESVLEIVASELARYLGSDNGRFDRERFLRACEV
jgi:hypothetical protein